MCRGIDSNSSCHVWILNISLLNLLYRFWCYHMMVVIIMHHFFVVMRLIKHSLEFNIIYAHINLTTSPTTSFENMINIFSFKPLRVNYSKMCWQSLMAIQYTVSENQSTIGKLVSDHHSMIFLARFLIGWFLFHFQILLTNILILLIIYVIQQTVCCDNMWILFIAIYIFIH
jgi:hypothetical protein